MTTLLRRPNTPILNWQSPGLGVDFFGVNIYRQVARTPAAPFELAGQIRVPPGRLPADVEAQHRWWVDLESGWAPSFAGGGRLEDGLNYWLTSVNRNGIESSPALAGALVDVEPTSGSWITCNRAWWLRAHICAIPEISTSLGERSVAYTFAGRGREVTRTRKSRPAKRGKGSIILTERLGHEQAHVLEAIAASGRQVALSRKLGDRYLGTLEVTNLDDIRGGRLDVGFEFIVTDDTPVASDYNIPAGIVLDGTNDYITTPDSDYLDPASGSFSFFFSGAGITSGASDYLLSKGVVASGAGYAIRTTASANVIEIVVRGNTTTSTVTLAAAVGAPFFESFDVCPEGHVIAASYDVTSGALTVYIDGLLVGTATAALGAIGNARMLFAGANNDGADAAAAASFTTGLYRSHGTYQRALSAADHLRLAQYLRGYSGVRAPGNASSFYDARDQACFSGVDTTLRDGAANGLSATLVGSPVTRGIPAPLRDLDTA